MVNQEQLWDDLYKVVFEHVSNSTGSCLSFETREEPSTFSVHFDQAKANRDVEFIRQIEEFARRSNQVISEYLAGNVSEPKQLALSNGEAKQ